MIDNVESQRAVCGSGMVLKGWGYEVKNSYFHHNGRAKDEAYFSWADGITVGHCFQCWIHNNVFEENTDIDRGRGWLERNGRKQSDHE